MKKTKALIQIIHIPIMLIITAVFLSGCSDSITNSTVKVADKYKAVTENEINTNTSLKVIPGAVLYVDLEHLNAPADSVNGDTGAIGEDVIPYSYTDSATHRFKLDASARYKVRLVSESGAVIFQLVNPGDTARVFIPSGNYKMYFTSLVTYGASAGSTQAVFVQPDLDVINSSGGALPQAGYNKQDLNTLLTTNKCIKCNLESVQLTDKNLSGVDLSYTNFSHTYLGNVNLSGGTFTHTDWTRAGANNCNFQGATFIFTLLNYTAFDHGDFRNVTFQRLNWDHTIFGTCDFRYATLDSGSAGDGSLDGSDLSYTTFTNVNLREMACENTKFIKSTFSNVYMYGMAMINSVLDSSKFINGTYFQKNTMRGSKIQYAQHLNFRADASVYDNCIMTGSTITNVSFAGGSLRAADLTNTVWNNVDVNAVNMCHQIRTGMVSANIQWNVDTDCWP